MPFIGREKELYLLEERYRSSKAEFDSLIRLSY